MGVAVDDETREGDALPGRRSRSPRKSAGLPYENRLPFQTELRLAFRSDGAGLLFLRSRCPLRRPSFWESDRRTLKAWRQLETTQSADVMARLAEGGLLRPPDERRRLVIVPLVVPGRFPDRGVIALRLEVVGSVSL